MKWIQQTLLKDTATLLFDQSEVNLLFCPLRKVKQLIISMVFMMDSLLGLTKFPTWPLGSITKAAVFPVQDYDLWRVLLTTCQKNVDYCCFTYAGTWKRVNLFARPKNSSYHLCYENIDQKQYSQSMGRQNWEYARLEECIKLNR